MLAWFLPLVAAATGPAPTAAGVPTADVAAAYVRDCADAATARGVDLALLRKRGWLSASVTVGKGKRAPFQLFARPDDRTFLSAFESGPQAKSCILLIPTPTTGEADALRAALGRTAGPETLPTDMWTTSTHRFSVTAIGNVKASGLRVTVKPLGGKGEPKR